MTTGSGKTLSANRSEIILRRLKVLLLASLVLVVGFSIYFAVSIYIFGADIREFCDERNITTNKNDIFEKIVSSGFDYRYSGTDVIVTKRGHKYGSSCFITIKEEKAIKARYVFTY